MLTVVLAGTGSPLVFPEGPAIEDTEIDSEVRVVDSSGRILAVIHRADVSMFSTDPEAFADTQEPAPESASSSEPSA